MSDGILHEPPILPQELVDKIIEELASDAEGPEDPSNRAAPSLFACAFVSRSFYTKATSCTFSAISIVDKGPEVIFHPWLNERIANLSNILAANPGIGHHAHSVTVTSRTPRDEQDVSPVLTSPHLPAVLKQLPNVRSFQLTNRFESVDWAGYSKHIQSSIITTIQSPILTVLHLQNIHGIPFSLLSPCTNLKVLTLITMDGALDHSLTSLQLSRDYTMQPPSPNFHASFVLESANIQEAATFIIPLVHCATAGHKIFGQLSHLTTRVTKYIDSWYSMEVLRQAADSLVSLDFVNVNSDIDDTRGSRVQINLAELCALRALNIHSKICPIRGGSFSYALLSLFHPSGPVTTLETLNIRFEWNDVTGGFAPFFHEHQAQQGWATLDAALSGGKFPSLRSITIQWELEYIWLDVEENLPEFKDRMSKKLCPLFPGLLPRTAKLLGDGLKHMFGVLMNSPPLDYLPDSSFL